MRCQFTADPKIAGGLHDTIAKNLLPKAIDGYASRQWLFGQQQPLGEAEPIAWKIGGHGRERFRRGWCDFIFALSVFAPEKNIGNRRFVALVHHVGDRTASLDFIRLFLEAREQSGSGLKSRVDLRQPAFI